MRPIGLLDVCVRAARAGAPQRRSELAAHEDPAVGALEAEVGIERPGQLDVRAEGDVVIAEAGVRGSPRAARGAGPRR